MNTSLFWTYFNTRSCKGRRKTECLKSSWTLFSKSQADRTKSHHFFEFEFYFLWGEFLAERSFPQQHVTVVCQQLRTLWLRLSLHTHPGWLEIQTHNYKYTTTLWQVLNKYKLKSCILGFGQWHWVIPDLLYKDKTDCSTHPFCFIGSSSLKIVASLTTAL